MTVITHVREAGNTIVQSIITWAQPLGYGQEEELGGVFEAVEEGSVGRLEAPGTADDSYERGQEDRAQEMAELEDDLEERDRTVQEQAAEILALQKGRGFDLEVLRKQKAEILALEAKVAELEQHLSGKVVA